MIMQETAVLQVGITDGTNIVLSSSGIWFSNDNDTGILQGNQKCFAILFEIMEAYLCMTNWRQPPQKKVEKTHPSTSDSPDTSRLSSRKQSHKSNEWIEIEIGQMHIFF